MNSILGFIPFYLFICFGYSAGTVHAGQLGLTTIPHPASVPCICFLRSLSPSSTARCKLGFYHVSWESVRERRLQCTPPTPVPPKEVEAQSLTPWAHTPALTIPHSFLLHPRVGGRTSGPSYPALPSLHSSASTGTQASSLQPSQAGCCFMPRVPLLS